MNIGDIMTQDPEAVQLTDSIMDAASVMRNLNIGFLPVLDGEILAGVVTDRDIVVRAVADGMDIQNTSIGNIISSNIQAVSPSTSLDQAASIMEKYQIRRLPVISDDGMLVGVCTLGDIAVRSQNLEKSGEILEQVSEPSRPAMAA